IAKTLADVEISSHFRSHQRLNGQKSPLPQDRAQEDRPQQIFRRDPVAGTPIARRAEVSRQVKMLANELPHPAWGGEFQRRFLFFLRCWRASTSNWALGA